MGMFAEQQQLVVVSCHVGLYSSWTPHMSCLRCVYDAVDDINSSIHSGSFHCPGCCPLILKGSKSKQQQKASVGEVTFFLWPPRKLNIIVGEDQNKSWTLTCCSCPEVRCDVGEDNKHAPLSWWHLSLDCENNQLIEFETVGYVWSWLCIYLQMICLYIFFFHFLVRALESLCIQKQLFYEASTSNMHFNMTLLHICL